MKPLLFFGHDPASIADRLGISRETARRYFYQRAPMPRPMRRLARIVLQGDLGVIDDAWHACRIRRDVLTLDTGETFTIGQLRAYYLRMQLLAEYERQLRNEKTRERSLAGFFERHA